MKFLTLLLPLLSAWFVNGESMQEYAQRQCNSENYQTSNCYYQCNDISDSEQWDRGLIGLDCSARGPGGICNIENGVWGCTYSTTEINSELTTIINCIIENRAELTDYQINRLNNYLDERLTNNNLQDTTREDLAAYFDKFTDEQLTITEFCLVDEEVTLEKLV